jgi:hypothetical protein
VVVASLLNGVALGWRKRGVLPGSTGNQLLTAKIGQTSQNGAAMAAEKAKLTDLDHTGENEPEEPHWVALPDPAEEPFSGACWFCQADEPKFTLEITHGENGAGWNYRLCLDCVERLVGTLEEGQDG